MRFKALIAMTIFGTVIMLLTGAGEEPAHTEAHIRLISTRGPLIGFGYRQNRSITPVIIAPDYFSAEIIYRGPPRFDLVPLPRPGPDGQVPKIPPRGHKDAPPPMAWFDLPPGPDPSTLILLVTPGERMQVIPDEPGMFPYGTMRVQNFCSYEIAVKLAEETTRIPPGSFRIVRPQSTGGKGCNGTILTYEDGEERPGYALSLFPKNNRRHLCSITPGPRHTGLVNFQSVEDNLTERPPPPAGGAALGEGGMPPARRDGPPPPPGKTPPSGKNDKKR